MAEQVVELAPGKSKEVTFEATPHVAKTYSVSVNGLTGSFRAIELPPPSAEILEVAWWDGASWHPISEPLPANKNVIHQFRIRNTGNVPTAFKIAWYTYPFGRKTIHYTGSIILNPAEEGYIIYTFWSGGSGQYIEDFLWELYGDDTLVDSMTVTITVI